MTIQDVLVPLFVEVALTFVLLVWMAVRRNMAFARGEVHLRDIALREPNWPKPALQVAYAFSNQFELPVLFYVLTILAWMTKHADLLFVVMAWIFVLCRIVQATIHVSGNDVRMRGLSYGVGALVLMIMWIIFAVRILLYLP
jgi:hypothetical protein